MTLPNADNLEDLPLYKDWDEATWWQDPHASFRRHFSSPDRPLYRTKTGTVLLMNHADLTSVAVLPSAGVTTAPDLFAGVRSSEGVCAYLQNHPIMLNPPIHRPIREMFYRPFTPRGVALFQEELRVAIDKLVQNAAERAEIDFLADFALPLTGDFWARLLHMTPDEHQEMMRLIEDVSGLNEWGKDMTVLSQACAEFGALVETVAEQSLAQNESSVLSTMAQDFDRIEISCEPSNVANVVAATMVEGVDTAAVMIANVFYTLLKHPDTLRAVSDDRSLIEAAVAEAIRYEPAAFSTPRVALSEIALRDHIFPKGTVFTMMWAAGNRDPDVFPNPDLYDPYRSELGFVSFGRGAHICAGRNLVTMMARETISALTAQGVTIRLSDGPYEWLSQTIARRLKHMPVCVEA